MKSTLPAFGICGWSGSGKTTLIAELVRHFTARRLRVAVIKHDVHGLETDREGKDSHRFFQAGADVVLNGPGESMGRMHPADSAPLQTAVGRLDPEYDLILIEGHKSADLARKVWLHKDRTGKCPPDVPGVARVLAPSEDRIGIVVTMVEEWLQQRTRTTPLCAGILFGGRSQRMGRPKHLLQVGGKTWLEHTVVTVQPLVEQVVLLGGGEVPESLRLLPILPDSPDNEGPLAGMLAAMRWRPRVSWLFVACDLPQISYEAVEWLLRQRAPGTWAVLPRAPGGQGVEPLFALYEFRARFMLERSLAPSDLARLAGVTTPELPSKIALAWSNLNTRQDVACFQLPLPACLFI
jgi:molybdopterin-guanine dinucleotide biosynthesis protein MobB